MKVIRAEEFSSCNGCGSRRRVREAAYGCEECDREIDLASRHVDYLDITVFRHGSESEHLYCCSWVCVFKQLSKIKTDYFVDLPFLKYDEPKATRTNAKAFFDAVLQQAKPKRRRR